MAEYRVTISHLEEVAMVLERLEQSIDHLVMSLEKRMDIKLCISEAVNNALIHGNRLDQTKQVTIVWEIFNQEMVISVIDEGDGVVLEKRSLRKLDPMLLLDESGKGLFLIGQLAAEVWYNATGNQVSMRMVW